jgi:hypothetical protein
LSGSDFSTIHTTGEVAAPVAVMIGFSTFSG